jgi:hypothetical protein
MNKMKAEIQKTLSSQSDDKDCIPIRSYNKKNLCEIYGITYKTLRKWLKPHDDYLGKNTKVFDAKKIEFIFFNFGYPRNI